MLRRRHKQFTSSFLSKYFQYESFRACSICPSFSFLLTFLKCSLQYCLGPTARVHINSLKFGELFQVSLQYLFSTKLIVSNYLRLEKLSIANSHRRLLRQSNAIMNNKLQWAVFDIICNNGLYFDLFVHISYWSG